MDNFTSFEWIPRNVELTIAKWMINPCSVVLIRGPRRIGKSSTVQKVASELLIQPITLYLVSDDNMMVSLTQNYFSRFHSIVHLFDVGMAIVLAVQQGQTVILDEIQNASNSLQVSLQYGIDYMAQQSLFHPLEWKNSGSLLLMGSVMSGVDDMIDNRKTPLYQRITAKITILSLNTSEMVDLFQKHNLLNNPIMMLLLQTLFRGRVHSYSIICKTDLLTEHDEVVKRYNIINEVFASELQNDCIDGYSFSVGRYGHEIALALKAMCGKRNKGEQLAAIRDTLGKSLDEAFTFVDWVLHKRYHLVEPVYSVKNLKSVKRYLLLDPMINFACSTPNTIRHSPRREDILRAICPQFEEIFFGFERFFFERWICEIIEDRYLIAKIAPIPHISSESDIPRFLPKVDFDIAGDIEIDIIVSLPVSNIIVFGSCKRFPEHNDISGLRTHCENFKNDSCFSEVLDELSLKSENLKEYLIHFNTSPCPSELLPTNANELIITLQELLQGFPVVYPNYQNLNTKNQHPISNFSPLTINQTQALA